MIKNNILFGHKDYQKIVPNTILSDQIRTLSSHPSRTTNLKSYQIRILFGQIRTLSGHAESEIQNRAQFYGVHVGANSAQLATSHPKLSALSSLVGTVDSLTLFIIPKARTGWARQFNLFFYLLSISTPKKYVRLSSAPCPAPLIPSMKYETELCMSTYNTKQDGTIQIKYATPHALEDLALV